MYHQYKDIEQTSQICMFCQVCQRSLSPSVRTCKNTISAQIVPNSDMKSQIVSCKSSFHHVELNPKNGGWGDII